jgi:hypothetical protein
MLANGGVFGGQRILSRTTVRLRTSDHLGSRLPPAATPGGNVLGASTYPEAVTRRPGVVQSPPTRGRL